MSQKSSVPQATKFVSQALKQDTTTNQHKHKSGVKTHTAAQSKNYSRYSGSYGQYKGSYGRNYGSSNSNGGLVGGADPGTYKP